MASAILHGAVRKANTAPSLLAATDLRATAASALASELGIRAFSSNLEACEWAEVIVLAVKPQVLSGLLTEIRPKITPEKLVVSIAAGASLERLRDGLGGHGRIIRAMPNAPALVGASATAIAASPGSSEDDIRVARTLFASVGTVDSISEHLMDAVTGLSGSGPGYALMVIEAMADAGVQAGLSRDAALSLSAQAVLGAARLVQETGRHPAVLRDMVTSPAGTTIAGVCALERHGLRHALQEAVAAAVERSKELGR